MSCNVFIIGKTGAGKSSLLNYLAGNKPLEDCGINTSSGGLTKGFHNHHVNIYGLDYVLIDSEGYEVSEISYWEELIKNKVNVFIQSDKADEAFPIILYCIDGSGNRVVDVDIDTIKRLSSLHLGIVLVITKTDICTYEDVLAMCNIIEKECEMKSVIITSNIRNQQEDYKIKLMEEIVKAWAYTVRYRFPNFVYEKIFYDLASWKDSKILELNLMKMSSSNKYKKELQETMNRDVQQKIEEINHIIRTRCDEGIKTVLELHKRFGEFSNRQELEDLLPLLIVKLQNISNINNSKEPKWNITLSSSLIFLTLGLVPGLIFTAIKNKVQINQLRKSATSSFMNTWDQINCECVKQKNKLSEYLLK